MLAHALASMRVDRPFLFHRVLYSLGPVREGAIDPEDYELAEDYLAAALAGGPPDALRRGPGAGHPDPAGPERGRARPGAAGPGPA